MTVRSTLNIDHVGILASSIHDAVGDYRKLGFRVIGPGELNALDDSGNEKPLGQQSAHVMFGNTYIELTAVPAPSPNHHLSPFLGGSDGLRLLILRASDIESSRQQCVDRGLNPGPIQKASRAVAYGEAGTARFRWFALPLNEYPEALLCFVQHDTFETVFQNEVTTHDNGATGLSRLILIGDLVPDRYLSLDTGSGTTVEARSSDEVESIFEIDASCSPPFAGLGIAVANVPATEQLLRRNGIPHRRIDNAVATPPGAGSGVGLLFERP